MTPYLDLKARKINGTSRRNLRDVLTAAYDNIPDERVVDLLIAPTPTTRTQKQNAYYWAVVLPTIRRYCDDSYTCEELHYEVFGPMFWPSGKYRTNPVTGRCHVLPRETKKMEQREFWDACVEPVCKWASEQGIEIPLPPPSEVPQSTAPMP